MYYIFKYDTKNKGVDIVTKTNIEKFYLREATLEDAQLVYDFIIKLAEYEELAHEVSGSIDDLINNVWHKKLAEVLIAYEGDQAIGFCLYYTTFSTFTCKGNLYLEDVYIDEAYRGKNYGNEIFRQLGIIAQERNCERFEWVCLDWNEPSIRFYEDKLGAVDLKEWIRFRLDKKGINNVVEK